jgi:glycosyltransferase involved in cell wall biosynthesis
LILIDGATINDQGYEKEILNTHDWILKESQVPHSSITQIIKKCDVLVRASKYESYGLSRIEGIMNLKPVVATNIGETRGMLLYEFGDHEMLKKQLVKALYSTEVDSITEWAGIYNRIAAENLRKLMDIIYSD